MLVFVPSEELDEKLFVLCVPPPSVSIQQHAERTEFNRTCIRESDQREQLLRKPRLRQSTSLESFNGPQLTVVCLLKPHGSERP